MKEKEEKVTGRHCVTRKTDTFGTYSYHWSLKVSLNAGVEHLQVLCQATCLTCMVEKLPHKHGAGKDTASYEQSYSHVQSVTATRTFLSTEYIDDDAVE
jgi:predicted transcriptional regulator